MQTLSTYRGWQFDALEKNLAVAEQLLKGIHDDAVFSKRDGGNGWTISEVLGHLSDFDAIFLNRARMTVETNNPELPFPDPPTLVIEHGFAQQDAFDVLAQWKANRTALLHYFQSLPEDETTWERPARHPKRGNFTLNDQLMLIVWHDSNHFHQITKVIQG